MIQWYQATSAGIVTLIIGNATTGTAESAVIRSPFFGETESERGLRELREATADALFVSEQLSRLRGLPARHEPLHVAPPPSPRVPWPALLRSFS